MYAGWYQLLTALPLKDYTMKTFNRFWVAACIMLASSQIQAQTIVFDIPTMSMTLPSVLIGAQAYRLVLRYDADGRMTITSVQLIATVSITQSTCLNESIAPTSPTRCLTTAAS